MYKIEIIFKEKPEGCSSCPLNGCDGKENSFCYGRIKYFEKEEEFAIWTDPKFRCPDCPIVETEDKK